ncbi:MAG: hypothetical protein KIT13_05105 [Burkholderiales bacterium]|nr:hypothetical protein [Burkholderiales bacterium]
MFFEAIIKYSIKTNTYGMSICTTCCALFSAITAAVNRNITGLSFLSYTLQRDGVRDGSAAICSMSIRQEYALVQRAMRGFSASRRGCRENQLDADAAPGFIIRDVMRKFSQCAKVLG